MKRLVVVDVSNLAHKALHTTGALSRDGEPTGVLYGVWKSLLLLRDTFDTNNFVFAFDSGYNFRSEIYPEYKAKRKADREKEDPDSRAARLAMYDQVHALRRTFLPAMGFPAANVVQEHGYEADDIIASVAMNSPAFDKIYIVSSDQDLYQCLDGKRVMIYKQKTKDYYTEESLQAEFGVPPALWASVKAWSGCTSDNIEGLPGVAEKTASKFMMGKLKTKQQLFFDNIEVYNRNIQLTRLPFFGKLKCTAEEVGEIDWNLIGRESGFYIKEEIGGFGI